MNAEATRIGLLSTRYTNSSGLDTVKGAYSTPHDLAVLLIECVNSHFFVDIFSQSTASFFVNGGNPRTVSVENSNPILADEGVVCGKTGLTPNAGAGITFYWRYGKRRLVTSTFQSASTEERITDNQAIMAYVRAHFTWNPGRAVFTA
jgi:D-alanyl-D-alanine carboxypeptidase